MFSGIPTRSWLLAMVLVAGVTLSTAPAHHADADRVEAGRTQTKSFAGGQVSFAGMGTGVANPYPSEVTVKFKKGSKIVDVNLTLHGMTTASPDDVSVMLAHGLTNQGVMSDTGGANAVNGVTIILDDEAAVALPDTGQIVNGTSYRPARYGADWPAPAPSALSVFDGQNPNGTWRLFVVDDGFGDIPATFSNGWTLTIRVKQPR
jgi:hypothetical protein